MRRAGPRRKRRPARRRSPARRFLDIALALAILGGLALLAARQGDVPGMSHGGNARIADGDSLEIGAARIRLEGIDAPEFDQTCTANGAAYPCGRRAREALARLIGGRTVTCEGWRHDRYERLLAVCKAGDVELNRAMVEQGWAVAYGDYHEAEADARAAGRGLWAGDFERPQTWRRMHGGLTETEHGGGGLSALLDWVKNLFGRSGTIEAN